MATPNRLSSGGKRHQRSTVLNVEQLEARMLMTFNSIEHALESLELVGATKNTAPAVAQAITVSGGNTVYGTSANLSVLGRDDKGEGLLSYSWSVTNAPTGGSVTFSLNGGNSAKNTRATFSKTGDYELRVTITDQDGASIRTTQIVAVRPAQSSLSLTASGSAISSGATLAVTGKTISLTSSIAATWTQVSTSTGGTASISSSNTGATITFNKVGLHTFRAVSGSASITFNIDVKQTLTTITVTPGTKSLTPSATQLFTSSGKDQFNASMNVTPTWSTTAGSITNSGLLTAPSNTGTLTVRATSGSVVGAATVTVASAATIQNTGLSNLVTSLFADGSINRNDMMQVLRSAGTDGTVDATELSDLRYIVSNAASYAIPSYVQILASNVVNGNVANATYQGVAAGNLAAGSSGSLLTKLVDKWFLGADMPTVTGAGISYKAATGPLFVGGTPLLNDQLQGQLGDCYFIATLGAIAARNPTAIANMFLDNGDGTYTVRFYTGSYSMFYRQDGTISDGFSGEVGTADYVTVNRQLPAYSNNTFAYSNYGRSITSSTTPLWIALAEKAYAQWNQTGKANRNGTNTYSGIEGGWMGTVNAQVLGANATSYILSSATSQILINALSNGRAVTIGTKSTASNGLVGSHAYTIKSYDAATQTFALHNPWGMMHPGGLTWAQLQANCSWMTFANATSTAILTTFKAAPTPVVRSSLPNDYLAPIDVISTGIIVKGEPTNARESVVIEDNTGEQTHLQLDVGAVDALFADDVNATETETSITAEAVDELFDHLDRLLASL